MTEGETSLRLIAMFDAIITEAINSFKLTLRDLHKGERLIGEKSRQSQPRDSVHRPFGTKIYTRFGKGGVILNECAMRLKTLFPENAVRLQSKCLDLFKNNMNLSSGPLQSGITIKRTGTKEERFKNQNRICTYVLRMPASGKIYIVVTMHIFKSYIRGWLGAEHDTFLLQSCCLDEPFNRSDNSSIREIVNDSDKNESFSSCKPPCDEHSDDTVISDS